MSKAQSKSMTVKNTKKEGPVKNKSSYMFFCADERKTINEEKAGLNNKEILVELGARWKVLKEEDTERYQKYVKIAEEDKQRYLSEKGQVQNKGDDNADTDSSEDDEKEVKKVKKTKSEKKPKKEKKEENSDEDTKPKTKINGYINFCKLKRAEFKKKYSNLQPKDITRELGSAWKGLSESEKEGYKLAQV
jgi:hypothetical protein